MNTSARNRLLATFAVVAAAIWVFTCCLGPAIGAEPDTAAAEPVIVDDPWAGFDDAPDALPDPADAEVATEAAEPEATEPEVVEEAVTAEEPTAEPVEEAVTAEEPTAEPVEEAVTAEEPAAEPVTETVGEEPSDTIAVDPTAIVSDPMPESPLMRFSFRAAPWKDVLEWFANQAGLSYTPDVWPDGSFNYIDDREYTPAEAIDLINSVLITKNWTLYRRGRMLMIANANAVNPKLIPIIPLDDLDDKGEFEMVSVVFQLRGVNPEQARDEIGGIVTSTDRIVILPLSQMIQVTDLGGRLRRVREVIDRLDNQILRVFELKHITPTEAISLMRPILGIDEDSYASSDGQIQFTIAPAGSKLIATGRADKLNLAQELLKNLDIGSESDTGTVAAKPILLVYPITLADPASVLAVLQTLLVGERDVRLAMDEKTGDIVALASQELHDTTIRPTIEKYDRKRHMRVFNLSQLDPVDAVVSIERVFGPPDENAGSPITESDSTRRRVIVHASLDQLTQIEDMLVQMGESRERMAPKPPGDVNPNMRILALDAEAVMAALQNKDYWWTRDNEIRVVMPSATRSMIRMPSTQETPQPVAPTGTQPSAQQTRPATTRAASLGGGAKFVLAAQTEEVAASPADAPAAPAGPPSAISVIGLNSGGVMIMGDDPEALDEFEQMLRLMAPPADSTTVGLPTVFFLQYAKAASVAQTLNNILGGDGSSTGGGGGGGGLGGIAGLLTGGSDVGALIDNITGGSDSGVLVSGTVRIVPETRLNALIIQANSADMSLIEKILEVLDRTPEDLPVFVKTQIVKVEYTQAAAIANTLLEIYRDRLTGTAGAGGAMNAGNAMQGLQQLAQAAGGRGGRGNTRGGGRGGMTTVNDVQTLALSVIEQTNSIAVAAPEPLIDEVIEAIHMLDLDARMSTNNAIVLRQVPGIPPDTLRVAVEALGNDMVTFSYAGSGGGGTTTRTNAAARGAAGMAGGARGAATTNRGATNRGGATTARGGAAAAGRGGAAAGGRGGAAAGGRGGAGGGAGMF